MPAKIKIVMEKPDQLFTAIFARVANGTATDVRTVTFYATSAEEAVEKAPEEYNASLGPLDDFHFIVVVHGKPQLRRKGPIVGSRVIERK